MGGGELREADATVGATPDVAGRLEAGAEPDTVAISGATQRLVDGLFECEDLGARRLKGVAEPVRVFRARRESDVPSRFEAAARRGLTPLIGRRSELDFLLASWTQAERGEAQAVLISGVAACNAGQSVRRPPRAR